MDQVIDVLRTFRSEQSIRFFMAIFIQNGPKYFGKFPLTSFSTTILHFPYFATVKSRLSASNSISSDKSRK